MMPDMRITIYNFKGCPRTIVLKADKVECLFIAVVSGDEQLIVSYKNGGVSTFDSCDYRTIHNYEGIYCIYNSYIDFTNYIEFTDCSDPHDRMDAIHKLVREMTRECKDD